MQLPVLLNYGVYGLAALLAVFGAISGLVNGIKRQTLRLISIGISALLSFLICIAVFPALYSSLENKTISELLAMAGLNLNEAFQKIVDCIEIETGIYILAIPVSLFIIPIIFIVIFVIFNLLMLIPCVIFSGIFGFIKKDNNIVTRLLGAAVGLLQGVIVAAVILIPVAGTVDTLGVAVHTAEERHPFSQNTETVANIYHLNLDPLENNLIIKVINDRFGYIYDRFTTVTVDGADVNMQTVVVDTFDIFVLSGDLKGADFNKLTEDNKVVISAMTHDIGVDRYIATIVSGMLRAVSGAFDSGAIAFSYPEPLLTFMNSFVHVFAATTADTVEEDITTMENVYYIISDSGLLKADAADGMFVSITTVDSNTISVLSQVTDELNSNPRFRPVAKELSKMSMELLLNDKGLDADAEEVVSDLTNDMNEIIAIKKEDFETEEEYRAEVSTSIDAALADKGIPLEEEQLEQITDFVITEFEGKEEIKEEEFADFMTKYYDLYIQYQQGLIKDPSDLPEDFPTDQLPDEIPEGGTVEGGTEGGTEGGADIEN